MARATDLRTGPGSSGGLGVICHVSDQHITRAVVPELDYARNLVSDSTLQSVPRRARIPRNPVSAPKPVAVLVLVPEPVSAPVPVRARLRSSSVFAPIPAPYLSSFSGPQPAVLPGTSSVPGPFHHVYDC